MPSDDVHFTIGLEVTKERSVTISFTVPLEDFPDMADFLFTGNASELILEKLEAAISNNKV